MASGTITGTTSNQYIDAKIEWTATPNADKNTSYVTAALYYKRNNEGQTTYGTGNFIIRIGNGYFSFSKTLTITENAWVKAAEASRSIDHNPDGSGSVRIDCSGSIPGTTLEFTTCYQTVTFDTIPRATTIDSLTCSTSYFTGVFTYKYTPKVATYYNRCNISLNLDGTFIAVKSIDIGQKAASQQTSPVTLLSSAELTTVYEKLPSATSGKLRFTFRTYSDSGYSTQVGDAGYKEITLSIPNDYTTQPGLTMTLSPDKVISTAVSELYVKGVSKVKATFSGTPRYGASIVSYKLNVAGKDYGSPYTSDVLTSTGLITVKGTVTDSRGFSTAVTKIITVRSYPTPELSTLSCNTDFLNGTITYSHTSSGNSSTLNSIYYFKCNIALNINGTYTEIRSVNIGNTMGLQTGTIALTSTELSTIYNKITSGVSATLRFTLHTYIGSSYADEYGDTSYKEITLSIPDNDDTKPTATFTVSPVTSLASPFNTLYIKGKTQVQLNLASGAGKYGATIKSYKVTLGTGSGTSSYTSPYLTTAGDVTVTGTVTDSRGFSRTYSTTITVIDYGSPLLLPVIGQSGVIAARCNSEGALDSNGTYLKIAAKRSYSKVVSGGAQKNYCKIQYRYKVEGGSYSSWTEILSRTATSDEIITGALLGGALSTTSTYVVQVRAIDDIGDTGSTTIFVSTEKVYMHRAGSLNSLAIGKYAEEENVVDVAEDITAIFRGSVEFKSEAWISRALGTGVAASTVNSGRWGGSGVYYRVCAGGKHIYVAFNVSFTTKTSTVRADSETIPAAYRPSYDVYALCPVGFSDGSRGIATVSVSPSGRVNIYAVHKLPGATLSSGETVNWIDGYIDFWT